MSDPIELPEFPTDIEFEDFISAQLQLSGYYLERNIIQREDTDVLELDIVKTDYSGEIPENVLIEVKSGKWGFNEIFKLRGWMTYLQIDNGQLIVKKERDEFGFMSNKAQTINIDLIQTEGDSKNPELIKIEDFQNVEFEAWRYSYWIERELIKIIKSKKKNYRDKKCYEVASDYYQYLKGGIYFNDTVAEKLDNLYRWHFEHPYLSASTSNEVVNDEFNDKNGIVEPFFKPTFYKCEINEIHSTALIEYLAKLQILKNAVDFSLYSENGNVDLADKVEFQIGDITVKKSVSLPTSFWEGINYIQSKDDYKYYPLVWSYFIYVFGGFILKKYEEEEYDYLARRTGVKKENINHAIEAFNVFFPVEDGWFFENEYVKLLKIFPPSLRGIGAYLKKGLYLKEEEGFVDLGSGDYGTVKDLEKWNNCGYFLLKGEY